MRRAVAGLAEIVLWVRDMVAFRVEEAAYEGLKDSFAASGIEVRSGIHPVLKGVRTFYVDDPDGNEVEIIAPE